MSGVVALVGGAEWQEGCTFDRALLDAAGTDQVLILPTAAAYEHPDRAVQAAAAYFKGLGATARGLDVLRRPDAEDPAKAEAVRAARFIYLGGGSPLHLRSVLKDTAVWDALVHAWQQGAVVAGSSAGAMVVTDPMVDPRGGAFTLGLGLVEQLAVIPHFNSWSHDKAHRTVALATKGLPVVGIPEQTALIRASDGSWRSEGVGDVTVFVDGQQAGLDALPG
ncbi:MAG TPA: Type 1 glutamine amidotransferase-like domain-containing protein [Acidimicrobiales bacterium]|jgi:cyanophycinase|nr:Type 1 glutamine amidotransferase-like domain-containing protein [Acidimicrobiales bacterium]